MRSQEKWWAPPQTPEELKKVVEEMKAYGAVRLKLFIIAAQARPVCRGSQQFCN